MPGRGADDLAGIVDRMGLSALNRPQGAEVRYRVGSGRSGSASPVRRECGNEDNGERGDCGGSSRGPGTGYLHVESFLLLKLK